MDMSVAALSVAQHQAEAWQEIGLKMLDKAMDTDVEMVEEALQMSSLDPNVGQNIDISV